MEAADLLGPGGAAAIRAENLADTGMQIGLRTLNKILRAALKRSAAQLGGGQSLAELFNEEEREQLADVMARVFGTAELLGRATTREEWAARISREISESVHTIREDEGFPIDITPLPPERAVSFFSQLAPRLGTDPERFGTDLRRRAFTMAAATETDLLTQVQASIAQRLQSGAGFSGAPHEINDLLDHAGVTSRNPQYGEMVFRTNTMDAYNQAADDERRSPDVIDTFPVWQYSNPDDSRSRQSHADRDGNYYPAAVPFVEVRGTGIDDAANCRCTSIPIDKWEWADRKKAGARIASGYPDVPADTDKPEDQPPGQASSFGRKAIKGAKALMKLANAGPTFAKETLKQAGFGPGVQRAGLIVATVGDFVVPGLPAASAAVTLAAMLRSPGAPIRVIKDLLKKLKRKKGVAAESLREAMTPALILRVGEWLESAENQDWAISLLGVAMEEEGGDVAAALALAQAALQESPEPGTTTRN